MWRRDQPETATVHREADLAHGGESPLTDHGVDQHGTAQCQTLSACCGVNQLVVVTVADARAGADAVQADQLQPVIPAQPGKARFVVFQQRQLRQRGGGDFQFMGDTGVRDRKQDLGKQLGGLGGGVAVGAVAQCEVDMLARQIGNPVARGDVDVDIRVLLLKVA